MFKVLTLLFFIPFVAFSQINGELIFNTNCAACHTIGNGNMVGPDLKGLLDRREESWARKFIQSSQTLIAEGDSLALALFQENNYIPMPSQLLSEDELTEVLNYIKSQSIKDKSVEEISSVDESEISIQENSPSIKSNHINKTENKFLNFIKKPSNLIFGFVLLVIIAVMYTLLKVIKVLAEYNTYKRDKNEE